MKQKPAKYLRLLTWLVFIALFLAASHLYIQERKHHDSYADIRRVHWDLHQEVSGVGVKEYPIIRSFERKDWHDYEFIKYEASRTGNGEQGKALILTDPEDIELDKAMEIQEGLHVVVSDKISVNRSILDTRPEQ